MIIVFSFQLASKKGGNTKIASWNFEVNKNKTSNSKISLADTITNSQTKISDNCIAPGTEGSFDINVNSKGSNVKIDYEIKLINEVNTPNNIYFFIKEKDKYYSCLKELFEDNEFCGSLNIEEINYRIFWKWPYEWKDDNGNIDLSKDKLDLEYAKLNKDYVFEIEVTGKQSIK